jgi:hypothetical protein
VADVVFKVFSEEVVELSAFMGIQSHSEKSST